MKQLFFLLVFVFSYVVNAQDLTGHWVAVTDYDSAYYAELYLVHNNGEVYAGHCYDTENGGYCRHWLEARYNEETKEFYGLDMEQIAMSKDHSPTDYFLRYEKGENGKEYLVGSTFTVPYYARPNLMSLPSKEDLQNNRFFMQGNTHAVRFVKVSDDYKMYDTDMPLAMTKEQAMFEKAAYPEVFEEEEVAKLEEEKKKYELPEMSFFEEFFDIPDVVIAPRKRETPQTPETPIAPETPEVPAIPEKVETIESEPVEFPEPEEEMVAEVTPEPVIEPEITVEKEPTITDKKNARTDKLLTHLELETQKVTLLIRDYGTVDNDSVTIFFNNKIIAENLRITSKAAEFTLELNPRERNELVFVANNLGDIPPNTARITLIADEKRYFYRLFTDEKNNALIVLENVAIE